MKLLTLLVLLSNQLTFAKNEKFSSFRKSKKVLFEIYGKSGKTFYCQCDYNNKKISHQSCGYQFDKHKKRSTRLEWEHVVPAEAFGQSFKEWREGHADCKNRKKKSFKGRKCASKVNSEFNFMESDLYNLKPAVGSINAMRSNYSMTDGLGASAKLFGKCEMRIENRKVQPPDNVKGDIARIYFYMDKTYPGRGIISNKNQKLYEAWDKLDPVDNTECEIAGKIKAIQGNANPFVEDKCQK